MAIDLCVFGYRSIQGFSALLFELPPLIQASLVAQLVKNPPAMQETPVRFLGQEDPLQKG